MQDFAGYLVWAYDEHTLLAICVDSIILRDPFIYRDVDSQEPTITTSVRRDKWKPRKEGPIIPSHQYTYDWDIEPDTTYAVSIEMFDAKHRMELARAERRPWLAEEAAVCPYLTIEYKCGAMNGRASHPTYKNAAASVLWLHQRKRIREALGRPLENLKHFSITIFDTQYTISEASFNYGYYYVHELVHGVLTDLDGLKRYIEWNNAIHTWGLGPNASSFKEDMVILLERLRCQPNSPPALMDIPPARTTPFSADASQQSGVV